MQFTSYVRRGIMYLLILMFTCMIRYGDTVVRSTCSSTFPAHCHIQKFWGHSLQAHIWAYNAITVHQIHEIKLVHGGGGVEIRSQLGKVTHRCINQPAYLSVFPPPHTLCPPLLNPPLFCVSSPPLHAHVTMPLTM